MLAEGQEAAEGGSQGTAPALEWSEWWGFAPGVGGVMPEQHKCVEPEGEQ